MKNVKHRRETLLNENIIRKKHNPSRQSTNNQQMFTPLSPLSTTYDEGRDFHVRDKNDCLSFFLFFNNNRLKKLYLHLDHH